VFGHYILGVSIFKIYEFLAKNIENHIDESNKHHTIGSSWKLQSDDEYKLKNVPLADVKGRQFQP